MSDRNQKMTEAQRARLQRERQQMIREAKDYQKQKKKAAVKRQGVPSGSAKTKSTQKSRPSNHTSAKSKRQPQNAKRQEAARVKRPSSEDYRDNFYVDETRQRREKTQSRRKTKKVKYKAPLSPKKRKARKIAAYCLIFAVVLAIGVVLSLTVLFKTEKINVEGNTLYSETEIIELSGVNMEENIFLAKFSSAPEDIVKALPYIKEARVDFKIPDTITITVKNAEVAYAVIADNQYYKISADGRILEVSMTNNEEAPVILCPKLKNTQVGDYLEFSDDKIPKILKEINSCIKENKYESIDYIDVNNTADISVIYDSRIKIVLGVPEDIPYKLKTAVTIINEKLDHNGQIKSEGTLDVSNCNSTKKSYFRDGKIDISVALPAEPTTVPPATVPETTVPETTAEPETEPDLYDDYDWQSADDGGYSDEGYDTGNEGDYGGYDTGNEGDYGGYSDEGYDTGNDGSYNSYDTGGDAAE